VLTIIHTKVNRAKQNVTLAGSDAKNFGRTRL
jgi:hypothetical protein